MTSLKSNIILNGINTVTGIIFPVITFPYAARVLLPEGIGAINFLNSIIGYIVLFTSLGIPTYAIKEIARHRDNKALRDKTTIEIILLSSILCLLGYISVWLLAKYVPIIQSQTALFYVLSLTIIFTSIGVNWFYQGIEDFKFITIRAIIIRSISTVALFIFVKSPSDLLIYGFITVGSTVGNNFINFIHLHKYIRIKDFNLREVDIFKHLNPSTKVFALTLSLSLYSNLNPILLGFITDDIQVGYFTAGTKITRVAILLISSIGTVLLPRCSNLVENGKEHEFNNLINQSLKLILTLSYPMTIGLIVLAYPITIIFCGNSYIDSIPVLLYNAPVIIFSNINYLICIQILYPKGKLRECILSVLIGGIIDIILNIILTPYLGAIGTTISILIAEISVMVMLIILGNRYIPFHIKQMGYLKYFVVSLIMGFLVWGVSYMVDNNWYKVILGSCVGVVFYLFALIKMKDEMLTPIIHRIIKK